MLKQRYVRKYKFEEIDTLATGTFVTPTIKRLEIHHFSHHNTAALSLDGDNLYFAFKFDLHLHKSNAKCEVDVDETQSVSSRSIQIHEVPLSAPRDFDSSTESTSADYQETEDVADISLHTHFGVFTFEKIEVKHKVESRFVVATIIIVTCSYDSLVSSWKDSVVSICTLKS